MSTKKAKLTLVNSQSSTCRCATKALCYIHVHRSITPPQNYTQNTPSQRGNLHRPITNTVPTTPRTGDWMFSPRLPPCPVFGPQIFGLAIKLFMGRRKLQLNFVNSKSIGS